MKRKWKSACHSPPQAPLILPAIRRTSGRTEAGSALASEVGVAVRSLGGKGGDEQLLAGHGEDGGVGAQRVKHRHFDVVGGGVVAEHEFGELLVGDVDELDLHADQLVVRDGLLGRGLRSGLLGLGHGDGCQQQPDEQNTAACGFHVGWKGGRRSRR
jgi:hypothetical protein